MRVRFWGVRGTFVAAGGEFVRYGGNTPCVELLEGDRRLILDLGSGAIALGRQLLDPGQGKRTHTILLSHTHIDHIMGFPFFAPAFNPNATIVMHGPRGAGKRIEAVLEEALDADYSPLYSLTNLSAKLEFHSLGEEACRIQGFDVACAPLPHGRIESWAFRVTCGHAAVTYMTDVEFGREGPPPSAVALARDADLLIHDATFGPDEYRKRKGWGHSSWEHALAVAEKAGAKALALFHHSPDRSDDEVDKSVALAKEAAPKGMHVFGAMEGEAGVWAAK